MKAGIVVHLDPEGEIDYARLMGAPDQCLVIQLPFVVEPRVWCVLSYPHDGDHDFSGGPGAQKEKTDA
jgi:hypothetical protein